MASSRGKEAQRVAGDSERVLAAVRASRNEYGADQELLERELGGDWSKERIAASLNSLLSSKRLCVFRHSAENGGKPGKPWYRESGPDEARLKGASHDEHVVLDVISRSQNQGIWIKTLREETRLPQPQLSRVLKSLESKELIKHVKSVNSKTKKVYMLANLEPSKEITGGAWYTNQEFDAEFIEVVREACHRFILNKGKVTLDAIANFIRNSNLCRCALELEDMNRIVDTLVYDGLIDSVEQDMNEDAPLEYKAATLALPESDSIKVFVDYIDDDEPTDMRDEEWLNLGRLKRPRLN